MVYERRRPSLCSCRLSRRSMICFAMRRISRGVIARPMAVSATSWRDKVPPRISSLLRWLKEAASVVWTKSQQTRTIHLISFPLTPGTMIATTNDKTVIKRKFIFSVSSYNSQWYQIEANATLSSGKKRVGWLIPEIVEFIINLSECQVDHQWTIISKPSFQGSIKVLFDDRATAHGVSQGVLVNAVLTPALCCLRCIECI